MVLSNVHYVLVVGILAGMLSGCSSIQKLSKSDLPTEPQVSQQENPTYVVEIHPKFGKAKAVMGEITKPTRVQEALEMSGALKKFSSKTVDLYRPVPGGVPLKMAVELKKGKQVRYEQDYALHPGDRIVVRQTSDSPIDKVVSQVFGKQ